MSSPAGSKSPVKIEFGAFIILNMRSGGNNFDYFPESSISIFNINSDWELGPFAPSLVYAIDLLNHTGRVKLRRLSMSYFYHNF